ncbi:MAG: glycoside hydrolase family 3 protein, partial [Xanthomonadales bacterium]|nr:glycoside hydrolase family 3 protein [Xanthomonadales bacterium]
MPVARINWSLLPAWTSLLALVLTLTACERRNDAAPVEAEAPQPAAEVSPIDPANWPQLAPPLPRDPEHEQRIADLLARMSLEEKVGQVLQADIATVTPQDVRDYHLGSILNGGGSAPKGDLRGKPQDWLELADAFWEASTDTADGGTGIPVIWGTDAVHGHSNIVGATVFPHNIGLGAANAPDLLYEIGRVTALEIAVTGLDWTFAPTLAVVRNDRWGRTYEGYSEDPRIVAAYAPRMVEGLQGALGTPDFLAPGRVLACAKHFVGDGGTVGGDDQGDNRATEAQLRDIHAAGYPPAIAAGVQTVMASFNSFHGRKLHGYEAMLNDVLVERMGFDGFVVGDWNGHGQVEGCSNESCAAAFNAGLDLFMVPNDFKALYRNTLDQVRSGVIAEARLDEAVARILRVKLRAGILDAPPPSQREFAGRWELLAAPEHRAIAREAVRRSLVLLKNENGLLPIAPDARVLVAGDGAHDVGKQSGGWTLSWQGTGNRNEHFPNGQSIYDGIREAVEANGGQVLLSVDGSWDEKPDVAIVVFGENPYAEGVGDRSNVDYAPVDGLELLQRLRQDGVATVSVFLSGRPLWVNPELNASDAFVAAWLPGSEGGGIADVLIAAADGNPRHDFTG